MSKKNDSVPTKQALKQNLLQPTVTNEASVNIYQKSLSEKKVANLLSQQSAPEIVKTLQPSAQLEQSVTQELAESQTRQPIKLHYQSKQPERPKPKKLQLLNSATNIDGEIFHSGDKITVSSPWGDRAIAEIVNFYADDSGCAWASYKPLVAKPGWTWDGGCMRASRLRKT